MESQESVARFVANEEATTKAKPPPTALEGSRGYAVIGFDLDSVYCKGSWSFFVEPVDAFVAKAVVGAVAALLPLVPPKNWPSSSIRSTF